MLLVEAEAHGVWTGRALTLMETVEALTPSDAVNVNESEPW